MGETAESLVLFWPAPAGEPRPGVGKGLILLVGRGWYQQLQLLQGTRALERLSGAVIATDAADPDLVHRDRLGLRGFQGLPLDAPLRSLLRQLAAAPETEAGPLNGLPQTIADGDTEQLWCWLREKGLSRREAEIVALVGRGLGNAEIAQQLFLSEVTVKGHLRRVFRKLGVERRSGLRALFS